DGRGRRRRALGTGPPEPRRSAVVRRRAALHLLEGDARRARHAAALRPVEHRRAERGQLRRRLVPLTRYLAMTPQAMRSPALPAGPVMWSSALAWTTTALPSLSKTLLAPAPR